MNNPDPIDQPNSNKNVALYKQLSDDLDHSCIIINDSNSKNLYIDISEILPEIEESRELLTFEGNAEKDLLALIKAVADWYPNAPKVQGNKALLIRAEQTLPSLYQKIGQPLPFDPPETGKLPTKLPEWEDDGKDGAGFYYYGEPFLWKGADAGGSPQKQWVETGAKLDFLKRFQKGSELPDSFIGRSWRPWVKGKLITPADFRGHGGDTSTSLDYGLYRACTYRKIKLSELLENDVSSNKEQEARSLLDAISPVNPATLSSRAQNLK